MRRITHFFVPFSLQRIRLDPNFPAHRCGWLQSLCGCGSDAAAALQCSPMRKPVQCKLHLIPARAAHAAAGTNCMRISIVGTGCVAHFADARSRQQRREEIGDGEDAAVICLPLQEARCVDKRYSANTAFKKCVLPPTQRKVGGASTFAVAHHRAGCARSLVRWATIVCCEHRNDVAIVAIICGGCVCSRSRCSSECCSHVSNPFIHSSKHAGKGSPGWILDGGCVRLHVRWRHLIWGVDCLECEVHEQRLQTTKVVLLHLFVRTSL